MKKEKSKKGRLTCLTCKGDIYDTNLTRTLGRKVWLWGTIKILEREDLKPGRFQWVCDDCLNSGRALTGNPEVQLYCDFDPYLVYIDQDRVCEKCHEDYVFRKEEQKYWYETLGFWVQSKPKHCAKCRREVSEDKRLNSELSTLLKDKEKLTIADMERLSVIYEQIKKPDKSRYYRNLVDKEKRKTTRGKLG